MITCRVAQAQEQSKGKVFTLSIKRGSIDKNIWVIGKDEATGKSYYLLAIDEKKEKMILPSGEGEASIYLSQIYTLENSFEEI